MDLVVNCILSIIGIILIVIYMAVSHYMFPNKSPLLSPVSSPCLSSWRFSQLVIEVNPECIPSRLQGVDSSVDLRAENWLELVFRTFFLDVIPFSSSFNTTDHTWKLILCHTTTQEKIERAVKRFTIPHPWFSNPKIDVVSLNRHFLSFDKVHTTMRVLGGAGLLSVSPDLLSVSRDNEIIPFKVDICLFVNRNVDVAVQMSILDKDNNQKYPQFVHYDCEHGAKEENNRVRVFLPDCHQPSLFSFRLIFQFHDSSISFLERLDSLRYSIRVGYLDKDNNDSIRESWENYSTTPISSSSSIEELEEFNPNFSFDSFPVYLFVLFSNTLTSPLRDVLGYHVEDEISHPYTKYVLGQKRSFIETRSKENVLTSNFLRGKHSENSIYTDKRYKPSHVVVCVDATELWLSTLLWSGRFNIEKLKELEEYYDQLFLLFSKINNNLMEHEIYGRFVLYVINLELLPRDAKMIVSERILRTFERKIPTYCIMWSVKPVKEFIGS